MPFLRRFLIAGPTPLHCIEAPTPGSGKGLLADCISIVVTGREAQPTTLPGDEGELRKKIFALLLNGSSVISFDNAKTDEVIDSSAFASVLTATYWTDRILGASRTASALNHALWLITANNPRFSFEMVGLSRCAAEVRGDSVLV